MGCSERGYCPICNNDYSDDYYAEYVREQRRADRERDRANAAEDRRVAESARAHAAEIRAATAEDRLAELEDALLVVGKVLYGRL